MRPDVEIMFAFSFFGVLPVVMKLGVTVSNHQAVECPPPHPPNPPSPPLSLWDRC